MVFYGVSDHAYYTTIIYYHLSSSIIKDPFCRAFSNLFWLDAFRWQDPVIAAHWAPLAEVFSGQWPGLHPARVAGLKWDNVDVDFRI